MCLAGVPLSGLPSGPGTILAHLWILCNEVTSEMKRARNGYSRLSEGAGGGEKNLCIAELVTFGSETVFKI